MAVFAFFTSKLGMVIAAGALLIGAIVWLRMDAVDDFKQEQRLDHAEKRLDHREEAGEKKHEIESRSDDQLGRDLCVSLQLDPAACQ